MIDIVNSIITKVTIDNFPILIKRDDLLNKDFSGNKARKFYYFFKNDFPHINTIISYGSNQSNAMYSLSVLAKLKGWNFIYYTYHISSQLQKYPNGNYKEALANGMQLIVDENFDLTKLILQKDQLFIDEGGAIQEAAYGIKILADELKQYVQQNNIKKLEVFLPSGTGTTALFLQKYLDHKVITTPCVGDKEYLKKQFYILEHNIQYHPTILKPEKKFHFGKLYKQNYKIWQNIKKNTNIEFDLLYDPIGWQVFLKYLKYNYKPTTTYIYIHQGGLLGNVTMQERYIYKYGEDI